MIVTGGGRRLEILAAAGLRDCANCHHRTIHFVVDDGEQLLSVDPQGLGRTKLLVCDVCVTRPRRRNRKSLQRGRQALGHVDRAPSGGCLSRTWPKVCALYDRTWSCSRSGASAGPPPSPDRAVREHNWDAPQVLRKHLLAVVACLSLAACTSSPADEVAPDQPTFVLGAPRVRTASSRSRRSFPRASTSWQSPPSASSPCGSTRRPLIRPSHSTRRTRWARCPRC
jgi:hypothetical protein